MIIGVDHLALNVLDIEQAKNDLMSKGFKCKFMESRILNPKEKKSLLFEHKPTHDFALFQSANQGVSIEVTCHGSMTKHVAPYHYHDDYIKLKTSNLSEEKMFWQQGLMFKETEQDFLTLNTMIKAWSCKLKLLEVDTHSDSTLDAMGYTCLAFLTNDLERAIEHVRFCGARDLTPPFNLTVNGQHLKASMFRTPGGAICELIQVIL
jgi:hypothetical protein